jgi:outer membrane protein TolC
VVAVKKQYDRAVIERDIVSKWYSLVIIKQDYDIKKLSGEQMAIKSAEDKATDLSFSIIDQQRTVEQKIRTDYNNILNLRNEINIQKLSYDMAKKKYDIDKLKYDKGLITVIDYLKTSGELDSALVAYNKAQLDYYTGVQDFKNYIG